jgi:hypothetical protein
MPFGRLWYGEPNAVANAIGYAEHRSRSHDAVIRVYDESGNVIETHEKAETFQRGEYWADALRFGKTDWLPIGHVTQL